MPHADRALASRCLDLPQEAKPSNPREKAWHELLWAQDLNLRLRARIYLTDRELGRPVQQVRMANPEGEKFQVEVDLVSARDRLLAALSR